MESIYFKTETGYVLKSEVAGFHYEIPSSESNNVVAIFTKSGVAISYSRGISKEKAIDTIEDLKSELTKYLKSTIGDK